MKINNKAEPKVVFYNKGYKAVHGVVGYDIKDKKNNVVDNVSDRLDAMNKVLVLSGQSKRINAKQRSVV